MPWFASKSLTRKKVMTVVLRAKSSKLIIITSRAIFSGEFALKESLFFYITSLIYFCTPFAFQWYLLLRATWHNAAKRRWLKKNDKERVTCAKEEHGKRKHDLTTWWIKVKGQRCSRGADLYIWLTLCPHQTVYLVLSFCISASPQYPPKIVWHLDQKEDIVNMVKINIHQSIKKEALRTAWADNKKIIPALKSGNKSRFNIFFWENQRYLRYIFLILEYSK
jgi:hypothetical protein